MNFITKQGYSEKIRGEIRKMKINTKLFLCTILLVSLSILLVACDKDIQDNHSECDHDHSKLCLENNYYI